MKRAFSLIEIAVVIVIIGILIAGVSKGFDLYSDFKISQAQSLTNSSRVGRIPNLALWLDSISSQSFDKAPTQGQSIAKWKDINPINANKLDAFQSDVNYQPTYNKNSIAGLPTIKFDLDCMRINLDVTYTVKPNISVFAVFKINAKSSYQFNPLFGNDYTAWDRFYMLLHNDLNNISVSNGNGFSIFAFNTILNKPYHLTYISQHSVGNGSSIRYNGSTLTTYTENFLTEQNNFINLGSDGNGTNGGCDHLSKFELGEFIIYDRALTSAEVLEVEEYLRKKWEIRS